MKLPSSKDISLAHNRISNLIHRTPVLTSRSINLIAGCEIFFKCENFQKVGAFKFRGATNAVMNLSESELRKGVATHSSGNHAAALALAASSADSRSYIVMPDNAPKAKIDATLSYGAEITYCTPILKERERNLNEVVNRTGATFIHPYENFNVICGQGTASKELLEDYSELEIIVTPVGGGGLLSGTAIWAKETAKRIKVIAAEPHGANDAFKSFQSGHLISQNAPNTICDGLLTSLGNINFEIIKKYVDDVMVSFDSSIIHAMRLIWERMKIIVEPSSSVPLAIVLDNPEYFSGKKVGIILTGGNVDLDKLPW